MECLSELKKAVSMQPTMVHSPICSGLSLRLSATGKTREYGSRMSHLRFPNLSTSCGMTLNRMINRRKKTPFVSGMQLLALALMEEGEVQQEEKVKARELAT